jgi:hypothetical protein
MNFRVQTAFLLSFLFFLLAGPEGDPENPLIAVID